jgi:2-polyprenyl-3-methyl-5-hydroxy-6-metoxy-1,4-benzoquinol methylase
MSISENRKDLLTGDQAGKHPRLSCQLERGKRKDPKVSLAHAEVISANVQLYRQIAERYDQYEICIRDADLQTMLNADLSRIANLVSSLSPQIRCLDCGGGSGNLSLKMLKLGWDVTVVDVSPEMLNLLREKAKTIGLSPTLINSSVEEYFCSSSDKFEVISFNSVLHHLYSHLGAVQQAADHVCDGGVFYSSCDPVIAQHPSLRLVFEAIDTSCSKVAHDPSDFVPGIGRRLKKLFRGRDMLHSRLIASPGDLAEYNAKRGIDETKIIQLLGMKGFNIVDHFRWPSARTWLTRLVNNRLRLMENFKIIAQRQFQ